MNTSRWIFVGGLFFGNLFPQVASAEVVGFFETLSGRQGVVLGSPSGYGPVQISLKRRKTSKSKILDFETGHWKLHGDKVLPSKKLPKGIRSGDIEIAVKDGYFYIPPFGSTYFLRPGEVAKIAFRKKKGSVQKIEIPIRGGEIKAFKVQADSLELLVYDRESKNKISKSGRKLFAVAPAGENILISVKPDGTHHKRELSSTDPNVFWADSGKLFAVDEKTLSLQESR